MVITELSGRRDPEELCELVGRYQDAMTVVGVRFDGYVANYLGDGILVCFGWPRTDEDGTGQAVRAGHMAVAAVRELSLQALSPLAGRTYRRTWSSKSQRSDPRYLPDLSAEPR
jgi:class 3 adenylate cyclase